VKLTLTREQSLRMHPKRHPIEMHYEVGCDADGRLLAVKARMIGDSGAYASVGGKVLERAAGHACGPYKVPHVDVEAIARPTPTTRVRRHPRGFGANQAAFAMEGMLDRLAEKPGQGPLGDPLAERARRGRHLLHRPGAGGLGRHQEDAAGSSSRTTTRRVARR
jgi:CO/xanthine dehydrogenase Mo-binding subunit